MAYSQSAARLLLFIRASPSCWRLVHPQHTRVLRRLPTVGISGTRSTRAAVDRRLDIHLVGDDLHVLDGDLLRQHDRNAIRPWRSGIAKPRSVSVKPRKWETLL